MKKLNILKLTASVLFASVLFTSCDKVATSDPIGDAGQTIVKFTTDYNLLNVNFVPTAQPVDLFDLRRDAFNNTELNRAMTIIVKEDPGAVTAYDPALMAPPAGTVVIDPTIPKVGANYTLSFAGGTFARQLKANVVNATSFNLSDRYALGFTIVSADADGKITSSPRTIIVEIGAKNIYDGKYSCKFTNYHPSLNPTYGPEQTTDVEMRTTGSNKVKIYWPGAGYAQPAWLSGGFSYFASQEPEYTVVGTAVTVLNSFGAPAPPPTQYTMNSSYNNRYDAASKTFFVKWGYSYTVPGVYDAACREWTQEIKYLGPR